MLSPYEHHPKNAMSSSWPNRIQTIEPVKHPNNPEDYALLDFGQSKSTNDLSRMRRQKNKPINNRSSTSLDDNLDDNNNYELIEGRERSHSDSTVPKTTVSNKKENANEKSKDFCRSTENICTKNKSEKSNKTTSDRSSLRNKSSGLSNNPSYRNSLSANDAALFTEYRRSSCPYLTTDDEKRTNNRLSLHPNNPDDYTVLNFDRRKSENDLEALAMTREKMKGLKNGISLSTLKKTVSTTNLNSHMQKLYDKCNIFQKAKKNSSSNIDSTVENPKPEITNERCEIDTSSQRTKKSPANALMDVTNKRDSVVPSIVIVSHD